MSSSDGAGAADAGDLFQEQFWGLLRRRYRPEELFELPATLGGDYGIEGYSTDGIAYQCYADRDSPTLRNRTDKQKQKLSRDLRKIKTNSLKIEAVLGGVVLEHYFLIVPSYHSADLVAYAVDQSAIVRGWGMRFVAAGFSVHIKTLQDYPAELAAALRDDAAMARVPHPSVGEEDVSLFPAEQPELVTALDAKLLDLQPDGVASGSVTLRDFFVKAFLAKEHVMSALEEWPQVWDSVERRRQSRQESLELESHLSSEPANSRVLALRADYQADLSTNVGGLSDTDAQIIALGQVAEWLMRCPLRFRRSA